MYVSKWIALRTRVVELCLKIYRLLCAAKQNPFGCNFSGNPSYSSTLLVKYMLLLMGGGPGIENMIELKQCLGYTVWISTHVTDGIAGCQDNWALIRHPSHPHHNGGGGGGSIIQHRAPCAVHHSNWSPGSRGPKAHQMGTHLLETHKCFIILSH